MSVGASAVQTVRTCLPYSGEIVQNTDLRNVQLNIPFLIWKQNPEIIVQVDCGFRFCFFYLFNLSQELRGKGDLTPL